MSATELVRSTCAAVADQAQHVSISEDSLRTVARSVTPETLEQIRKKTFDTELHFVDGSSLTAQYLLVLDAINFCFWQDNELEYEHIARGLKAAVLKDTDCIGAVRLACMDGAGVRELVGWPRALPLEDERARLLREVGQVLCDHFDGDVTALISAANGSAVRLVGLVTQHFPGFRDHAIYRGQQVFLYKRAQIWVGDLWGAFGGQGLGGFTDIEQLTMFADYRVPVTLLQLGILTYSPELLHKIETGDEFAAGSESEIEIRACTVVAVERLRECLVELHPGVTLNSVLLDWWLWEEGEKKRSVQKHHRTLTIYY